MSDRKRRRRDRSHSGSEEKSRKRRRRSPDPLGEKVQDKNWREGDWNCEKCRAHNYSRRSTCFECGTSNENNSPSNRISGLQDWDCAHCKTFNFARRKICFKCQELREDISLSSNSEFNIFSSFRSRGYDRKGVRSDRQFKDGDWICPGCTKHNFARRLECFGCGISRNAPKTSYVNPAFLPPTKSSKYVPSALQRPAQSEPILRTAITQSSTSKVKERNGFTEEEDTYEPSMSTLPNLNIASTKHPAISKLKFKHGCTEKDTNDPSKAILSWHRLRKHKQSHRKPGKSTVGRLAGAPLTNNCFRRWENGR